MNADVNGFTRRSASQKKVERRVLRVGRYGLRAFPWRADRTAVPATGHALPGSIKAPRRYSCFPSILSPVLPLLQNEKRPFRGAFHAAGCNYEISSPFRPYHRQSLARLAARKLQATSAISTSGIGPAALCRGEMIYVRARARDGMGGGK